MNLSRRSILSSSAALASMGAGIRVSLAANPSPATDVLVILFMRGGQDGLQLAAPAGDPNYIRARPSIRVQSSGPQAGFGIGTLSGTDFYLHPNLPELKPLYDSGKLAIVQAVGIPTIDRSHFVCQDLWEHGMGDNDANQPMGWLARHTPSLGPRAPLSTVATGTNIPVSLLGDYSAVALTDISYFNIVGGDELYAKLVRAVNDGDDRYQAAVRNMVDTVATVQIARRKLQSSGGAEIDYGYGPLADSLKSVAKLIKMDVGLDTATVDMGSWDHHTNLANGFGFIATDFSRGLAAFWKDIEQFQSRVTVVTMTEFGRRFTENSNIGLDHGAASTMMLLGGNVNGGKIYGDWPGLGPSQLDNDSLRVTNDYRRILSEVIVKRHGEKDPKSIFPTVKYSPMGLVTGDDSGVRV